MISASFNQLANTKNSFQGDSKRVLCVCSAGLLRSPTAAHVLAVHYGYNTRAAGCREEYALIPVSQALLHWADEVVFMEECHKRIVEQEYPEVELPTHYVLDVPDMFVRGDPQLEKLILKKYEEVVTGVTAN